MSRLAMKPYSKWLGVVSLIIFGLLIAWEFSAIHSTIHAVIVGIVVAAVFVFVTKSAGIEPGWPKS
jgi:hypothetical protein